MVWSAARVAEEALRTVGVFSPYDLAPDPEDFDIALGRLHALTAYLVSTEKLYFFQETEQQIELEASRKSYGLTSFLSTNLQYIEQVWYTKDGGNPQPVKLVRISEFEELQQEQPSLDIPENLYVERKDNGLMYPYGVPSVSGYKLHIRGRKFSGDLTADGGSTATEFAEAWSLCLVDLLAFNIGKGPVTKLPNADLDRLERSGNKMQRALVAYNQHESVRKPRQTQYHDL